MKQGFDNALRAALSKSADNLNRSLDLTLLFCGYQSNEWITRGHLIHEESWHFGWPGKDFSGGPD
jgi:hypothetical protein